ncbi:MAG: O-antigen ligase family protein [Caldilineaceae bacterium]|nr:O-antigen ligase family protein [Caldilineaceae bacterium]MBP8125563.1 O-antigen ligase family protein [Caldilineaceae bacterium]MBP9074873.1 O-antigen ligase family protein [Caldilineaceae bacterium]
MKALRPIAQFLTTTEIFLAGAAVGAVFVTDRALLPALIALALYWPIRWLAHGRPSVRTPVDWPLLFLVAVMVPVTLWATALPDLTQPQVMRFGAGIGFLYAMINWANRVDRLRWLLRGLLAAGAGLAAVAPFIVLWGGRKFPLIPQSIYTFFTTRVTDIVNPNVMGGTLALLIPVALALLLLGGKRVKWVDKGLALVSLIGMAGILVLTQSRGALMGTAAAGLVILLMAGRWGQVLAAVGSVGILGFLFTGGSELLFDAATTDATFGGLEQRVEIWSRAIYMVQDFSFTGVGMGSFGRVADLLYPFFLAPPGQIPHAHNLYLQVAVDLGIPGLLAWLAVLFTVMVAAWQVYRSGRRHAHGSYRTALGAGLLASQTALMVHGLTDATVWGMTKPAVVVWAVWGLTLAAHRVYVGDPERAAALDQAVAAIEHDDPSLTPGWAEQPELTASAP